MVVVVVVVEEEERERVEEEERRDERGLADGADTDAQSPTVSSPVVVFFEAIFGSEIDRVPRFAPFSVSLSLSLSLSPSFNTPA